MFAGEAGGDFYLRVVTFPKFSPREIRIALHGP